MPARSWLQPQNLPIPRWLQHLAWEPLLPVVCHPPLLAREYSLGNGQLGSDDGLLWHIGSAKRFDPGSEISSGLCYCWEKKSPLKPGLNIQKNGMVRFAVTQIEQ